MAEGIDNGIITSKQLFKTWLEKLQQESWQLELLISGFVLYGVYGSHDLLGELKLYSDQVDSEFVGMLRSLRSVRWKLFSSIPCHTQIIMDRSNRVETRIR